jgi:hypothetical protein
LTAAPDLEAVLRTVEPALRLVSERRLLKVIVYLRDHDHAVPINADLPLWVSREDLVAADLLPEEVVGHDPHLLLLTDPDDRMLEDCAQPEQLGAYWRCCSRQR